MSLQSMTGFARSEGSVGRYRWAWELRSVNGKGFDLRLRLPPGSERLESEIRNRIGARFARGNLQASLSLSGEAGGAVPVINEQALTAVIALAERVRQRIEAAPLTMDGLLALRGVIEFREPEETAEAAAETDAAMLAGLNEALAALEDMRLSEGAALARVLLGQLATIENIVRQVEADPARTPEAIRARIAAQVALLADAPSIDPQRLHAEAALLATKADLREEIDRLHAHVAAARSLIEAGGPVGRRLDFLAQEFNRETNTICSKSNAATVTAHGLELKVVVDQLREQIQNIE
jgi:uncharacterized protein (TIGR00255 family)